MRKPVVKILRESSEWGRTSPLFCNLEKKEVCALVCTNNVFLKVVLICAQEPETDDEGEAERAKKKKKQDEEEKEKRRKVSLLSLFFCFACDLTKWQGASTY